MRSAKRKRENARDRKMSLVRKAKKYKEVVREARDRDSNSRAEAVRGITKDMGELGKELERSRDEVGTEGDYLTSSEDK